MCTSWRLNTAIRPITFNEYDVPLQVKLIRPKSEAVIVSFYSMDFWSILSTISTADFVACDVVALGDHTKIALN